MGRKNIINAIFVAIMLFAFGWIANSFRKNYNKKQTELAEMKIVSTKTVKQEIDYSTVTDTLPFTFSYRLRETKDPIVTLGKTGEPCEAWNVITKQNGDELTISFYTNPGKAFYEGDIEIKTDSLFLYFIADDKKSSLACCEQYKMTFSITNKEKKQYKVRVKYRIKSLWKK